MSERDYEIKSVIVCDDLREEKNGKEILIGVYNSAMIFGQFPARWPKLVFRIGTTLQRLDFKRLRVKIVDKNQTQIFSLDQPIDTPPSTVSADDTVVIAFSVGSLMFPEPSKYTLLFGLDREPEEIFSFAVRGPLSDDEARRIR